METVTLSLEHYEQLKARAAEKEKPLFVVQKNWSGNLELKMDATTAHTIFAQLFEEYKKVHPEFANHVILPAPDTPLITVGDYVIGAKEAPQPTKEEE